MRNAREFQQLWFRLSAGLYAGLFAAHIPKGRNAYKLQKAIKQGRKDRREARRKNRP